MMAVLNFYTLDNIDHQPVYRQQAINRPVKVVSLENTECNYLVMFFILGVFMLVISDQIK